MKEVLRTRTPSPLDVAALHGRARDLLEDARRALPRLEAGKSEGRQEMAG